MNEISEYANDPYSGAQEIRRACPDAHVVWLADALRDTLARALMAEHDRDHILMDPDCTFCGQENWTHYQGQAHKILMGDKL